MANKNKIEEIENALLDQLEKLNDDSIATDPEEARRIVDRSKAMSGLASNLIELNRLKLDAVKLAYDSNGLYDSFLGLEDKSKGK